MNARWVEILSIFLNSSNVTVEELSSRFNISQRMIRYDIDEINFYLKEHNFNEIYKKPNSPLKFIFTETEKERLRGLLKNINKESYIFSSEERIAILLYDILSSKDECNYNNLIEKLRVSKTTLSSDVRRVKVWLNDYELKIIKVSNRGFKLSGEEDNIRKAMNSLLTKNEKYNIIHTLEKIYNNEGKIDNLSKFNISSENLEYIKTLVREVEEDLGIFSEEDFMILVVSIFVIINRGNLEEYNFNCKNNNFDKEYKKEYEIALKLVKNIENKFNIKISDYEMDIIISNILSGSKNHKNLFTSQDYFEACSIAGTIIDKLKNRLDYNFKMDNSMYESFTNHLKSLVFRLKYNIDSKNPILDSIMNNYKEEFILAKDICRFIEVKYKTKLSNDEIGYIVMYIKAASEKINSFKSNEVKNIIIVCQGGFATGRLIESKIKKIFNVNIIAVTSIHSLNKYVNENRIDFIITSLDIDNIYNVEILKVNPILKVDDINKLKNYLLLNEGKRFETITDILDIIDKNCKIIDKDKLIYDLNQYITGKETKGRYLRNYISEEFIQLNIEAKDWNDAIKKAAYPLLKKGIIDNAYVEDMINNVNNFGPYIVVDDLVAIPHSKPNNNVNGFGISITTFKENIILGEHKSVRVFITLASNNNKNHIEIIKEIMNIIENEESLYKIIYAKKASDVIKVI